MKGSTPRAKGVMSDSGWSNYIIFRNDLEGHFLSHVQKGNDDEQPNDGHYSHVSHQLMNGQTLTT